MAKIKKLQKLTYKEKVMAMRLPKEFVIDKLNKENLLNNNKTNNGETNEILLD
jgi:hypothetical protein